MPPRRPRCQFKECRAFAQAIIGDCNFCKQLFCGQHRLLEAHMCPNLEDCKKELWAQNADQLKANGTAIKGA
ncbi:hypothetical protein FQN57_003115 [Myotisia sp. PD_48]|nr:hypothetical protein FQN57_003115 [Myotisia sp. PD_48]